MSTMGEVKAATEQLSAQDRWELYRWLGEVNDVRRFRQEELQRDIAIGIEQAESGETAPLDVPAIQEEVRRRLSAKRGRKASRTPHQCGAPWDGLLKNAA